MAYLAILEIDVSKEDRTSGPDRVSLRGSPRYRTPAWRVEAMMTRRSWIPFLREWLAF